MLILSVPSVASCSKNTPFYDTFEQEETEATEQCQTLCSLRCLLFKNTIIL